MANTLTNNMLFRILLTLVLFCAATSRSYGHDTWMNGQQVDPKTKELCCSEADTKIADDLVKEVAGGVEFTDRPGEVIPIERLQPSPDGHWWRSVWGDKIRCVFAPYAY